MIRRLAFNHSQLFTASLILALVFGIPEILPISKGLGTSIGLVVMASIAILFLVIGLKWKTKPNEHDLHVPIFIAWIFQIRRWMLEPGDRVLVEIDEKLFEDRIQRLKGSSSFDAVTLEKHGDTPAIFVKAILPPEKSSVAS